MTATQFLELVVSLSVQAAIVIIVTHWLGRLVNNERIQCRLWTICYVVLLTLIVVALLFPHPRFFQPWASIGTQNVTTLVTIEMQIGRVLFWVWLAGAAISLLVFTLRSFQVNRFLKTCEMIDPEEFISAENRSALPGMSDLPLKQRIRLLTSSRLTTPFCAQFHYPYIVVPEYLLGFERQKFNFIIRHELEHLKTGHPLQLFLQRLVEVIFWFHPMVWWASQESALSREFACDEAAIDSPSEIALYLRTLLTIIEYGASQADETPTPLAFGRGKSIVAKRARRLTQIARTQQMHRRAPVSGLAATFSLVMAAVLMGFVWLPVDALASPRANWSPWPSWTAGALHDFGYSVHDFDAYRGRIELHELFEHAEPGSRNVD
tara:strand:+ start:80696 stop:81829 length:1134 start_codon:yes stop_codon:yes gene_type:complete